MTTSQLESRCEELQRALEEIRGREQSRRPRSKRRSSTKEEARRVSGGELESQVSPGLVVDGAHSLSSPSWSWSSPGPTQHTRPACAPLQSGSGGSEEEEEEELTLHPESGYSSTRTESSSPQSGGEDERVRETICFTLSKEVGRTRLHCMLADQL